MLSIPVQAPWSLVTMEETAAGSAYEISDVLHPVQVHLSELGSCTFSTDRSNKTRLVIYEEKYGSPSLDGLSGCVKSVGA
jgi:hypothetical protein